jgi:hypothetical protein
VRPARGGEPLSAREPLPYRPGEKTLTDIVLEDRG